MNYIDKETNRNHIYKENPLGMANGKFCLNTQLFFRYYQANESENMGGVDRCDKCNEVVRV